MKIKSQKQAILLTLARGKKLSVAKSGIGLGAKISTRINELEKEYKFRCERVKKPFDTPYGTSGSCFEYSMKVSDRKKVLALLKKELNSKK